MHSRNLRGATALAAIAMSCAFGIARAADGTPPPAPATTPTPPSAEDDDKDRPIERVVVTAQKREERLQNVPITITNIPGKLFKDANGKDIKDLQVLVPGMTVTSTSSEASTTARLRGIGTVGDNPGLESSVGVVIDGIYRPRNSVGFGDLGEVQRIEVLKGPQGTLFGVNTTAGVINILTALPDHDFGWDAQVTAGSFNAYSVSGAITGELGTEELTGRLFGVWRQRDGFYDIINGNGPRTRTDDADQNYYSLRGQMMFEPSSDFQLRLIGDYTNRDEQCCAAVALSHGNAAIKTSATLTGDFVASRINLVQPGSIANGTLDPFNYKAYANFFSDQQITDTGVSAQADWDTHFLNSTVTSITGLRDWKVERASDPDYTAADILRVPNDGGNEAGFKQFSEELRWAGENSLMAWLIGGFYAHETLEFKTSVTTGGLSSVVGPAGLTQQEEFYARRFLNTTSFNAFNPAAYPTAQYTAFEGTQDEHHQKANSYAFFTNETITILDPFFVTLGLRYTHEEKEMTSHYDNQGLNLACLNSRINRVAVGTAIALAPPNPGESNATRSARFFGTVCSTGGDPIYDNLDNFQTKSENQVTGTAKAMYRFDEDFMAYGSFARGYKAGGFNLDRERTTAPGGSIARQPFPIDPLGPRVDFDTSFAPETVIAYELGTKTSWFDGTMLVNIALFHQTYENFQLNTFTGTQFIVTPIPEVVSRGVDTDFILFAPVPGLTVQGGLTYAETQYGEFNALLAGTSTRLPNSRISFAPLYSASLAATYDIPLGDGLLIHSNASGKYNSTYNTGSDLNRYKIQPEFFLVNARIGIATDDGRWALDLWSTNLLDEEIVQVAFDAPAQSDIVDAFLAPPRMFGVTLSAHH